MAQPAKKLLHLLKLERKEISAIYFYAILSGLIQLVLPIGIQSIIGFVLGATMVTSVYILISIVIASVFIVGLLQINQMKIIEKIQQRIFVRNAFEFAESIPKTDLSVIDTIYMPEKVNRFFDTLSIQKGFSKLLLDIPVASIQILLGLTLLAFYHPLFIVFDFIIIFIIWLILRFTSQKGIQSSLQESTYKYNVVSWFEEMARVNKSFKFSQGSHLNLQKTDKNLISYLTARTNHFKILLFQYKTLVFFKIAITGVMLVVGTYLLLNQQLNIGEFIAAEIVIITVIAAVEKLIVRLDSAYDVITGLEKVSSVTELPKEQDGNLILESNNEGLSLKVNQLEFHFSDGVELFHKLSFSCQKNELVGIDGNEGSGKSTLFNIINGNYKNFKGSVLINDIPIQNYQLETFRSKIGIYHSEQDVFEGTVWENISLNRPNVDLSYVMQIARDLGLNSFLNSLEKGLEANIDPQGKKVSSTVLKKILLLRALANNPSLLLLDEPWIGLDEVTSLKLKTFLLNKNKNTTILVITKDKNFLNQCNTVINLKN